MYNLACDVVEQLDMEPLLVCCVREGDRDSLQGYEVAVVLRTPFKLLLWMLVRIDYNEFTLLVDLPEDIAPAVKFHLIPLLGELMAEPSTEAPAVCRVAPQLLLLEPFERKQHTQKQQHKNDTVGNAGKQIT